MNLEAIEVSAVKSGKKEVPRGPFKIESYDTRGGYCFDRFVLVDKDGNRVILKGSSSIDLYVEEKPKPVKKFLLKTEFNEMEGSKKFDSREDAEQYVVDVLNDNWKWAIEEIEELPSCAKETTEETLPF